MGKKTHFGENILTHAAAFKFYSNADALSEKQQHKGHLEQPQNWYSLGNPDQGLWQRSLLQSGLEAELDRTCI